jgi:DNA-damage-inducible protein J
MKTDFIRARIEPGLKNHVHVLFKKMGVTPTQAIRMFYHYVDREHAFPFDLSIPNNETAKTIREAMAGKGLIKSKSLDDLFSELDI